jgi:hypothetical protein
MTRIVTRPSLLPSVRSGNRSLGSKLVAERCGLVAAASYVLGEVSRHSSRTSEDGV